MNQIFDGAIIPPSESLVDRVVVEVPEELHYVRKELSGHRVPYLQFVQGHQWNNPVFSNSPISASV
jgi:hypothetical protein